MVKRELSDDDKYKLSIAIQAKQASLYSKNNTCCPNCSSNHVSRNGVKNDNQRMICNNCNATFTLHTPKSLRSELDFMIYIQEEVPATNIAAKMNIAVRTVYQRRAALLETIRNNSPASLERYMRYATIWKSLPINKKPKDYLNSTTLCYIEKDGAYLMLHRNKKENDINKGKWIGVGGHFKEGETARECVCREVLEETGYTLSSVKLRGIVEFISDTYDNETMYLFTADTFTGEEITCNEGDLKWIKKEDILSLNLWEGDKIFLKMLLEDAPFFHLELIYQGDTLIDSVLLPQ